MSDRLAAIRTLHDQVGGEVPVMGWVEGAFAEAADLRGESTLLIDLVDRPAWVRDLLEVTVETAIAFARAQIEAGADIIGLGDALASQVSPKMYRTFALPYEQRIFKAVHDMGALARLHICGNTTRLLADMAQSGADIVDLDWMVDLTQAAQIFGDGPAMCGNFDPVRVMLQGTPDLVRAAVAQCLRRGGSRLISGQAAKSQMAHRPRIYTRSRKCVALGQRVGLDTLSELPDFETPRFSLIVDSQDIVCRYSHDIVGC
jgi:MtaA/CmuA family methyltransferase